MNMQDTKPISAYKQGLRSKIIETALKDFLSRGIRAVRMDDVATELKISKRTLYENGGADSALQERDGGRDGLLP